MKRKIKIGTILLLVAMTGLLTGCGHKVKNEAALQEDLMSSDIFSMPEGSSIAELSVIKRLTDKKNKQDTVWVSVEIDREAAQAEQAYVMNYTEYNDGWRVDSIEQYYGDEVSWEVTPKTVPTQEEIMADLTEYSRTQIMQNSIISEESEDFFEEGKYAATFYTGTQSSDVNYVCCIDIERPFELMDVNETHVVSYVFDTTEFEWLLIEDEITDSWESSYAEGTWSDGNGMELQLTYHWGYSVKHDDGFASEGVTYDAEFLANGICTSFGLNVDAPSSHRLYTAQCSFMDDAEKEWTLEVYPWVIICYSEDGESFILTNESAETEAEYVLENSGILDGSAGEDVEPYVAAGKEFLNCIWSQRDMEAAMEKTCLDWKGQDESDENFKDLLQYYYDRALDDRNSLDYDLVMVIPTYCNRRGDDWWMFEELKKRGITPGAGYCCDYLLKMEGDGISKYERREVCIVEEQDQILICGYTVHGH